MNKTQLIDVLAERFQGNKRQAAHALESVLDTITREVSRGEKVAITGFGSFERKVKEARTVRNPRTGARLQADETAVAKFTPGANLKEVVAGVRKLPQLVIEPMERVAAAASSAASRATSRATTARKATAKKAPAAKKATAKKATAKKATAKKATAKKTTAKKTTATKSGATKSTATKSTAKRSTTKKS